MMRGTFCLAAALSLWGCSNANNQAPCVETLEVTGVQEGQRLFADPNLSASLFNDFSCATCHAVEDGDTRILAGRDLRGVTARPRTWGGNQRDLLTAVNFCLVYFMRGQPLPPDDIRSRSLWEYLKSLESVPGAVTTTLPMTVVRTAADVARGDPTRGQEVYARACQECHGDKDTGAGRINDLATNLTEVRAESDQLFPGTPHALVFAEKVRHGQFFGVGGNMPLYSLEALSNEDLGALFAYLGL